MSKQTAVEWLIEQLFFSDQSQTLNQYIEQAKAIEKEQIEDAWDKRCYHGVVSQTWHIETKNGEQYYNETYGGDK
jgi:hypothetical protein